MFHLEENVFVIFRLNFLGINLNFDKMKISAIFSLSNIYNSYLTLCKVSQKNAIFLFQKFLDSKIFGNII